MSSNHTYLDTCDMCIIGSINDNRVTRAVNGLILTPSNTYNKAYMNNSLIKRHFTCINIAIYDFT